ncbi:PREDICTED: uncharacterized protein LOC105971188 [Erythranthe guttata]|uniref:uncharacterized protein LOC105971188 n=1 Tax=Erythranthe guttata TaxID=4155 RepID=UPI00064DE578|nr:PREDICTED: uncharacterized protein LOC105971188 [Erythranthe guttata]|eukprot:XP_012851493.1 PREDICTED: uncharacterized protein LOC105971188 [Erythranthe guttata]
MGMHLESEEEYRLGHQVCETNEAADFRISEVEEVNHETDGGASGRENMEELLQACVHPDQHESLEESTPEVDDFRKLIEEWCIPLYDGCQENSKLSFVLEFYKIKSRGKMSDKTFSDTLQLIKKIPGLNIPDTFYKVKKLIGKLGCGYVKIDACENDCMLFWKDDADLDSCRVCNASRWKTSMENQPSSSTTRHKRVPKKVLRHFPLIPRLKSLFICERTSINMRWHAETRCDDGVLRHPADSDAWKEFDKKHESFSLESRNVRLGLATDGFNPFGSLSSKYSTWPVIVMIYNLPPNLCMQRSHMMMSLLISGPKGPKNGIDVYLQPLIDELKELWISGIQTFDMSTKQYFNMRAALLWTINDFPALGNLSGWSTSGYLACPSCAEDTVSERLYKSNKQCFMGHSRFPEEGAPPPPSGEDVLSKTEGIDVVFGVGQAVHRDSQWRKRSIFFELPYWKDNLIRHNLDVMHIEKNIGELLLKWLLNLLSKNDGFENAKEDIEKIKKTTIW